MRTVIIVQARMASTRLPGKVLKEVLGKSLLEFQLERLKRVGPADQVVVATTVNPADNVIADLCRRLGVACFRGNEEDVLDRYYRAAGEYRAEAVVRVTADCPLIDPAVIDLTVDTYVKNAARCDYIANTLQRTYPRGMDCEVFSYAVLREAYREATGVEREHVTMYIYRRPERYRMLNVAYERDESTHRWTIDTPEDYELIRRILEVLYPSKPDFTLEDCLALLEEHPEWSDLNRHVKQKSCEPGMPSQRQCGR